MGAPHDRGCCAVRTQPIPAVHLTIRAHACRAALAASSGPHLNRLQERADLVVEKGCVFLAQAGGRARIPTGRIVSGTQVNVGWGWHLEDVTFAESTIELCDGRPSDVERQGIGFGGGRYCPWAATIIEITSP